MTCSAVICWPRDVDFPYFRQQINKHRACFERVIIVMTQFVGGSDYTKYIGETLNNATVIGYDRNQPGDWRNNAVNVALKYVTSDLVLFLEQDFLTKGDFYEELIEKGQGYGSVGFLTGNRFHPACLLAKMELVNNTNKDFSANPPIGDHFQKFSDEIKGLGTWTTLEELGLPEWYHLAGLTQNFRMNSDWYGLEEFYTYLKCSEKIDQPHPWRNISNHKIEQIEEQTKDVVMNEKIKSYFEEL